MLLNIVPILLNKNSICSDLEILICLEMDTTDNLFGDADDISSGSDDEEGKERQNENAEGSTRGSPAQMQHDVIFLTIGPLLLFVP